MKLTLQNTDQIVDVNGVPARVWRGQNDSGIEVHALITRIAVLKAEDNSQFDRELREQPAPIAADSRCFPLRLIL
jgi:hypothetical protein